MKKSRQTIIEALKCFAQLTLIPIAGYAEDRIYAFRLYRDSLTLGEQVEQCQKLDSLFKRLERAARRQERQNSIALPQYYEQQRRCSETSYCYAQFGKKILFQAAIWYAVMDLNSVLLEHWPHGQRVLESTVVGFAQRLDHFWWHVYYFISATGAK